MARFFISRMLMVACVGWTAVVNSGVNQKSDLFTVFRQGEVPIFQVWQLATYPTGSLVRCAERCLSLANGGCGGFLYEPESCSGSSSTGLCQLIQFFGVNSMLFRPTPLTSCQKFYKSMSPVQPGKIIVLILVI